jgi:Ca2+-transporting ATPase
VVQLPPGAYNVKPGVHQTSLILLRGLFLIFLHFSKEIFKYVLCRKCCMEKTSWHALETSEILSQVHSSESGLSSQDAAKRHAEQGSNVIEKTNRHSWLKILLDQFINPLTLLLIFAGSLSLFLKEGLESIAIFTIILINAFLGFFQEFRASKSIEALAKMSARTATVKRDGSLKKIPAEDVVVGDILILEAGDVVAADARLLQSSELHIEESSLTGESVASEKDLGTLQEKSPIGDRKNMVFMGTTVSQGKGEAIVVAIGMDSEFGHIAKSLDDVQEMQTPLQRKFAQLAKQIGVVAMILIGVVFAIAFFKGEMSFTEILLFSLVLAVGTIPSALPLVVTLGLSFGASRLAKQRMLIRNLSAAESLGAATFICTDKTGTLTKNQMTVTHLYLGTKDHAVSGKGYDSNGTIADTPNAKQLGIFSSIAWYCNDTTLKGKGKNVKIMGDPMEAALKIVAEKAKVSKGLQRIKDFPFDSERKLMSVVVKEKKAQYLLVKGAPELLLKKCSRVMINGSVKTLTASLRKQITEQQKDYASKALRVLGFAYKQVSSIPSSHEKAESSLTFVGLSGMLDPARDGVKEAISECHSAGIKVMMITGDHEITAEAIAREVGLLDDGGLVLSSEDLDKMSPKELAKRIENVRVVARAYPLQKLKIIEALQKRNHIVAMTGDGVNDAPALKKADIGISMGKSGTEVAKEASKSVLVDDHFATIVDAIKEGRNIYDKIVKSAKFLLSCNLGEIATILFSLILGLPLPLIALQVLMINMLTDTAPATGLGLERAEKDVMKRPPRDPKATPITWRIFFTILIFGVVLGGSTIYLFTQFLPRGLEEARTVAFTTLVFMQLFNVLTAREFRAEWRKLNIFSNPYLLGGILLSLGLQFAVIYIPFFQPIFGTVALDGFEFIMILGFCVGSYVLIEITNYLLFNLKKHNS